MAGRATATKPSDLSAALKTQRYCATVGCEGLALAYSPNCANCDARIRHEKSEARCRELGLVTVEDKRAYCLRMAKSFGRGPSFETWARNITQRTVDLIALQAAGTQDTCLERLRSVGAIDGRNKLIPVGEAREIAAEAYRMEKAHLAAMLARELAERGQANETEGAA